MYCTHCGASIENDSKFCSACGEPCVATESIATAPVATETVTAELSAEEKKTKSKLATQSLVWGILGLAFAVQTGFLGIIFSIIGLSKSKRFMKKYNEACAKVKTGRGLATAGLIVGIVVTAFVALIFGFVILMTALENMGYLPADTSPIVYSPYLDM